MKKIIAFCTAVVLLLCCGCSGNTEKKTGTVQYTIALNPSVMLEDGTIDSLRNSVAKSMSADVSSKTSEKLYTNTAWQWISKDEDGGWSSRLIRSLSNWSNADGKSNSGVPYAYKFDDNGISSLSVYDSAKMKIAAKSNDYMPESGVLMSVTDGKEEAVCYTAENDVTVIFSDRNEKGISLVSAVSDIDTEFWNNKSAKNNLVLRIYKNNRIYWQEVLNCDKASVSFPEFSEIELKKGDRLLFTVCATDDIDGIVTGNCDIPAYTATETVKVANTTKVEMQTEEPARRQIPFIYQHAGFFTMVTPKSASEAQEKVINSLSEKMESTLGVSIDKQTDDSELPDGYVILVGDTSFEESKSVSKEIKNNRKASAGDFIIRMSGNKLVINAGSDVGLKFAVDFFMKNYCKNRDSYIDGNLNYVSSKFNSVKNFSIAGKSVSDCKIVVSRFASFMDLAAADYLNEQITKVSGIMLPVIKDSEKVSGYEIVIGETTRTSSSYSTSATTSNGNNYGITVSEKNTVIKGESSAAVNAGVIAFSDKLLKDSNVNKGFTLNGKYDGGYSLTDGYKLAWSDEFNGDTLSKLWINNSRRNPSVYGGTCYSSIENSFVENGALVQQIRRDGNDVIEADITAKDRIMYKYGYAEVRIRMSKNVGSWGALWMVGPATGTMMGEVDIFENFGDLFSLKSNLHTWGPGDEHENILGSAGLQDSILNYSPGTTSKEAYSDNYHTLGFEWSKGYMAFYVDGVKHTEYKYDTVKYDCFEKPFYFILSHWGGEDTSTFANCILPDDFTSSEIYYDWIRIYQTDDAANIMYTKK